MDWKTFIQLLIGVGIVGGFAYLTGDKSLFSLIAISIATGIISYIHRLMPAPSQNATQEKKQ